MLTEKTEQTATLREKIFAAVLYGVASVIIMMVNKVILTGFHFPSYQFVAIIQYVGSLCVLGFQRWVTKSIEFPMLSSDVVKEVLPLPFFFLLNTVTGLGATKSLSMPMFVLLRRFSVVMTLGLEIAYFRKAFGRNIHSAVFLMIFGAAIAAYGDIRLDGEGCALVLLNDLFTALQGVFLRLKMDRESAAAVRGSGPSSTTNNSTTVGRKPLNSHGLMFYNNLFSLPVMVAVLFFSPAEQRRLMEYDRWRNKGFVLCLIASSVMGFGLNYAYYLCTKLNSPLTTTVVGCFKNIFTSYLGMIFMDYTFSFLNFTGVSVSVVGSLLYNYAEFGEKHRKKKKTDSGNENENDEEGQEDESDAVALEAMQSCCSPQTANTITGLAHGRNSSSPTPPYPARNAAQERRTRIL